jgi:ketosteroid isomerase-like protein
MSKNIDTVKDMYECFGRGDMPGILAHLREDVEWGYGIMENSVPWHNQFKGRDTVPSFFEALCAFDMLHFEPVTT